MNSIISAISKLCLFFLLIMNKCIAFFVLTKCTSVFLNFSKNKVLVHCFSLFYFYILLIFPLIFSVLFITLCVYFAVIFLLS